MEWRIWFITSFLVFGAAFRCNARGIKANYRACFVNRPCEIKCESDDPNDPAGGIGHSYYNFTNLDRRSHRNPATGGRNWAIAALEDFVLDHNDFEIRSTGSLVYSRTAEVSHSKEVAFLARCTNHSNTLVAAHEISVLNEPVFQLKVKPHAIDAVWEQLNSAETLHFGLEKRPHISCSVVSVQWSVSYWEKDGNRLESDLNERIQVHQHNESLKLGEWNPVYCKFNNTIHTMGLLHEDSGEYRCVVDYRNLIARSDPITIIVPQPPENSEPRNLTIRYHADNAAVVTLHWERPAYSRLAVVGYGVSLMGVDTPVPYTTLPEYKPDVRYRKINHSRMKPGTWYIVSVITYFRSANGRRSVEMGKRAEVRFKTLDANELESYKESPLEKQLRETELVIPDEEDRIQNRRIIANIHDLARDAATSLLTTSPLTISPLTPAQSSVTLDETLVLMISLPCIIVFFAMLAIIVVLVIRIKYPKKTQVAERSHDEEESLSGMEETRVEMTNVGNESVEPVKGTGLYPLLQSPENVA